MILATTRRIREDYKQYCLNASTLPLSVDEYLRRIEEYTDFQIELIEVNWRSHQIRGSIHRFDASRTAKIYVAPRREAPGKIGITYCEQRFVAVKEACHLLIDHEDTYTTAIAPLIESLVFPGSREINSLMEPMQSEVFAVVAAMELLFPFEQREEHIEQIAQGKLSYFDVANKFKVPERQVFWILSDMAHPALKKYHELLNDILKQRQK